MTSNMMKQRLLKFLSKIYSVLLCYGLMDGKIVTLAKKIVRYKEHLRLYNDCEDRKLLLQGLYKESSVTFEDKDLRDVCQKFYDFASVAVRSKVKRHLDKSIHKMQNELQHLKEIARRDLGQERSELLFVDIREKCERLRCKMSRSHERKMENFYQLGDFDIDDEDFRILRNRIEGLLDKQSKRKRK